MIQPSGRPSDVGSITVVPVDDSTLRISWAVPTNIADSELKAHAVDYDFAPEKKEVQSVVVSSSSNTISGTFCLSFDGASTSPIPYDATNVRLEAALESLGSIGDVSVSTSRDPIKNIISWLVTFVDSVGDVPQMVVSCNNLVGSGATIKVEPISSGSAPSFASGSIGIFQRPLGSINVPKSKTIQTITVNASSVDLNGKFYVFNSGEVSLPIDVYSTAAQVKYILESMLTIDNVDVSLVDHTLRTDDRLQNYGRSWIVTFQESHSQSLLVSTAASGAGSGTSAAGGQVIGTSTMVFVERSSTEKVPNFIDNSYVIPLSGPLNADGYSVRVSAYNSNGFSTFVLAQVKMDYYEVQVIKVKVNNNIMLIISVPVLITSCIYIYNAFMASV